MKTSWLLMVLLTVSGHTWAQVGDLYNADVIEKTSISDPARALDVSEGNWLAFSVPVLEGTRSPCCWKGRWNGKRNGMGEVGCSLELSHQSYGTRSDSPFTDNVIVYSEIRNGQVHDLRVFGQQCPVEGKGTHVTWIDSVDNNDGLDWLETAARSPGGELALFAMALHRSAEAGQRLYSLAKETDSKLSGEAIFWLGDSRGKDGFKLLKRLLSDLPRGESRREINFALSQNDTPEAAEFLLKISKSDPDPEQRGGAMFWLAEEHPQLAEDWLLEVIKTEQDENVLEQAVFAISQLPGDDGSQLLFDIARDDQASRAVRRQALFWLAQSDDDKMVAALTELLTR